MTDAKLVLLADHFRNGMTEKLSQLVGPLLAYQKASSTLAATGVSVTVVTDIQAIAETINNFLKETEQYLTSKYAGNGTVAVSFKRDRGASNSFYRTEFDLRSYFREPANLNDGLQALLADYPFSELALSAAQQCQTLEARGLQDTADKLAINLRLVDYGHGNRVKAQRGRMICATSFSDFFVRGYSYSDWDNLVDLSKLLQVVEAEMGDLGGSAAVNECVDILREAPERFESRTKLLEGRPIEFVVFKGHMDIRIATEVADTILAFLSLNCSRPIVDINLAA